MKKKLCVCYLLFTFAFVFLLGKTASIMNDKNFKVTALTQWNSELEVSFQRGTIYDRNLRPLVNDTYKYISAVNPNNYSADALFKSLPKEKHVILQEKLSAHVPFIMDVPDNNIYAYGVDVFEVPVRYSKAQTAVHIIGSLDGSGKGISGLEKCYDSLLRARSGSISLKYPSNAFNEALNLPPHISDTTENAKGGIVTTLDKDIQRIAEEAGKNIKKGAIVVSDPSNGDILASVSFPSYDTENMAKSLDDPLNPFINRAFSSFAVGSTFKLLTAATALEEGISESFRHNCKGYIQIGSNTFKCHNLSGHGQLDMKEAMKRSCNPYFINLSQNINGQSLLHKARLLGFGESAELAHGYFTSSGSLPQPNDLLSPEALANFSFGQGILTATPIQIASLISSFANGGRSYPPRLIEGSTFDGKSFFEHSARYEGKNIASPSAVKKVKEMMISVVEEGSGKKAKPEFLGAGGKTASAQSGQYLPGGEEIVHAWFSGFYPAKYPKYTIVVLCEGEFSGGDKAAPVFKEICDKIYELKGEEFLNSPLKENLICVKS